MTLIIEYGDVREEVTDSYMREGKYEVHWESCEGGQNIFGNKKDVVCQ